MIYVPPGTGEPTDEVKVPRSGDPVLLMERRGAEGQGRGEEREEYGVGVGFRLPCNNILVNEFADQHLNILTLIHSISKPQTTSP